MFNIIVIGAEDTEDYEFVKQKLIVALQAKAKSGEGITIFTTGDSFIDQFTQRYNIDKYFFQTDWKTYGKNALKYRNEKIVENANAVYFFENNKKDSRMLYNLAKENGIPDRYCIPPNIVKVL
jgi:hypothetical protein